MSSNNAIGSAAVVLTANADGLASGLDKAAAKVDKFSGDLSAKAGGGKDGGGGLLQKLIFGGGIGAGIALVEQAAGVIGGVMGKLGDPAQREKIGLTDRQGVALDNAAAGFERLQNAALKTAGTILANFAPAFTAGADAVTAGLDAIRPYQEWVSRGFGAVFFTVIEIGREVVSAIWDVVTGIAEWAGTMTGLSETSMTVEGVIFDVFNGIGKAGAYVWDTLKAGAGYVAIAFGTVVEKLGELLVEYREAVRDALNITAKLGDYGVLGIGGMLAADSIRTAAAEVEKIGAGVAGVGAGIRRWGEGAVAGFGDSAKQVDAWFDKTRKKFEQSRSVLDPMARIPIDKLAGANLANTTGAYSIIAKFNAANMGIDGGRSVQEKQLDEQRRQTRLLERVEDKLDRLPNLQKT